MRKEINLLPEPVQRSRSRRLYLSRLGRFLNRIYLLLSLVIVVLVIVLGVIDSIRRNMLGGDIALTSFHSDVASEVRYVNQVLGEFEGRQKSYAAWSPQWQDVLTAAPEEVRLTGLEVDEAAATVLLVRGITSSRSAVVVYQQRLEKLDWVERVEAPLQNFALEPESSFFFSLYRQ